MSTPAFTFTERARPVIQIGIGYAYVDERSALWDQARWDTPGDVWGGAEPAWRDVTCDTFTFRCEYGRQRSTDRFVVGQASVVLWNATGWADPNPSDEPGTLTMRPGRAIRFGVEHVNLGTRWLFRGFIDALTPVYSPTDADTVELSCIDALGEVNRAKLLPLADPQYAGDPVDVRIGRLLLAASWPESKTLLDPTGDSLIATTMGGQLADMLGQAADSGGGNVFGDLDGNIVYRARDWQIFEPGTPPDGAIGNVGNGTPGHWTPGVPAAPAHLDPLIGTVASSQVADDPAGQRRVSADPPGAAGAYTVAAGQVTVGAGYGAAIRWHQYEVINRARLMFPGVTGNHLEGPVLNLTGVNEVEFIVRASANWDGVLGAAQQLIGRRSQATQGLLLRRTTTARVLAAVWNDGANQTAQSDPYPAGLGTQLVWWRCRITTTTVTFDYSTSQAATTPTTWTQFSSHARPGGAMAAANNTLPIYIADTPLATFPFAGRIARAILRNITTAATLLDVSENNAGTMTDASHFVASSGQTITVVQSAGNTVVQPQADRVVWRFDAIDYPGLGLSYIDPRGRMWTLAAPGVIVPAAPAVPPIWVPGVPADVCPTRWERPFARADLATRVIIGRDQATAQQLDDVDGRTLYGIEPFERTDLLTERDDKLTLLGQRILRVRSALTAPRIRSVSLDASTTDDALDLMATVDVFRPSRYRCRLQYPEPRGLVFDAEHFATGIVHEVTPSSWTADVNLDLAAPYAAPGGRWDGTYWDQATWATPA